MTFGDKAQICIPKTGNVLLIHLTKHSYFLSIWRLIISSHSGVWITRPIIPPRKMTALKRFYSLVELDQCGKVDCQKCIRYPIEFHTSIRNGNEIQYSGYETTILDRILRRNHEP